MSNYRLWKIGKTVRRLIWESLTYVRDLGHRHHPLALVRAVRVHATALRADLKVRAVRVDQKPEDFDAGFERKRVRAIRQEIRVPAGTVSGG